MRTGEVIAERFVLEDVAGQGGLGWVYRAQDRHTNEPVAVKLLRRAEGDWLERFAREARMLAELKHPHIVEHIAHGQTGSGEMYLAMEWLDGEDLDERLSRDPLIAGDAVLLATRVAEVLAAVHARNIIHRDIKPSNLFLCSGSCERVKLLDFGIARLGEDWVTLTGAGVGLGTPGYMAPEQVLGWKDISSAVDVFALGVVLYECLTGERCYPGGEMADVLWAPPPHPRNVVEDLPESLDALVTAMMHRDAEARPSAAKVAEQLTEISAAGGLSSQPTSIGITRSEQHFVSVVVVKAVPSLAQLDDGARDEKDADATTHLEGGPVMLAGDPMTSPAARVAAASGARIGRLGDGSLAAFYTGQGAAVDLAERAARCAIAIKQVVGDVPVGVCTDSSVTTGRLPVREIMERSSDLVSGGDGIHIDEVTAALIEHRFEVRGAAPSFQLVAPAAPEQQARTLLGKQTRCVGRKREIGVLHGLLEECTEERIASAALVTGVAGIGKSRVRHELVRQIQEDDEHDVIVLFGRGDPMSAGTPFGILGSATRTAMGILDSDPREVRLVKLSTAVGDSEQRESMLAFLGEIVGAPLPSGSSTLLDAAREDPKVLADQIRLAWRDWVTRMCATHTVLLILEDLHWGDVATVKLVDSALRALRDQPFMVLALGRPEVHDLFPKLWAGRELQEIRLGPLRDRVAERLVRDVLGDQVGEDTMKKILARADGNPFYLEELIRTASGRGISDEAPGSVIAMMQARLRGLPAEARRVLRAASIFGAVFWDGAVRTLMSDLSQEGLADWIGFLESEELVVRRGDSAHPSMVELEFRHDLIREAAYQTLTEDDRAAGHRLAGEWLESSGTHGAAVLAEHFERGGLPERAVGWYRRAAEQAAATDDPEAAIRLAKRGVACGAAGEDELMLKLIQADESIWQGKLESGMKLALEALEAAEPGSPAYFRATRPLSISYYETGANTELVALGRRIEALIDDIEPDDTATWCVASVADLLYHVNEVELADRLCEWVERFKDVSVRSQIKLVALAGKRAVVAGDIVTFLKNGERAAQIARDNGLFQRMLAQVSNIGAGYVELGAYARAEKVLREHVPVADRYDAYKWKAWIMQNLGVAVARLGNVEEGIDLHLRAIGQSRSWSIRDLEGQAHAALAHAYCWVKRFDEAENSARMAIEILDFSVPLRNVARGVLAYIHLCQDDPAQTLEVIERMQESFDTPDTHLWELDSLYRLTHAQALWETGEHERAKEVLTKAVAVLEASAARITDSDLKETFLAVPENAETFQLASQWLAN